MKKSSTLFQPTTTPAKLVKVDDGWRYFCGNYRSIIYDDEKKARAAIASRFPKATIDGGTDTRDGK